MKAGGYVQTKQKRSRSGDRSATRRSPSVRNSARLQRDRLVSGDVQRATIKKPRPGLLRTLAVRALRRRAVAKALRWIGLSRRRAERLAYWF